MGDFLTVLFSDVWIFYQESSHLPMGKCLIQAAHFKSGENEARMGNGISPGRSLGIYQVVWIVSFDNRGCRDFLAVQWLRLHAPNAGGPGSIHGQGTRSRVSQLKILQAATKTRCSQINK